METEYTPSLLCTTLVTGGSAAPVSTGAVGFSPFVEAGRGSSYSIASPMSVADELPVILTFTKSPIW